MSKTYSSLQVVTQTQDLLVLKVDRKNEMFLLIKDAFFFFALSFLLFNAGVSTELRCARNNLRFVSDPQANTCQIIESRLFRFKVKAVIPINQIREAIISREAGQILLLTDTEPIYFASLLERQKVASPDRIVVRQINSFIRNPQAETLLVRHDGYSKLNPLVLMLMCPGVVLLIIALRSKFKIFCIFNKKSEKMFLSIENMFGKRVTIQFLEEIREVSIKENLLQVNLHESVPENYEIILLLKSGKNVSLEEYPPEYKEDCKRLVNVIRQFLNLSS